MDRGPHRRGKARHEPPNLTVGDGSHTKAQCSIAGSEGRRMHHDFQLRGNRADMGAYQRGLRERGNNYAEVVAKPANRCSGRKHRNYKKLHVLGKNTRRKSRDHSSRGNHSFPRVDTFSNVDELIKATADFQYLPPHSIAAIWHRMSYLLTERRGQQNKKSHHLDEFEHLYARSLKVIPKYSPTQLCQTALCMANIIKLGQYTHREIPYRLRLRKINLFQTIAVATLPLLTKFDTSCHVNLCKACSIAEVYPRFKDGTGLIEHISYYIVALKDMSAFRPHQLCTIVSASAEAESSGCPSASNASKLSAANGINACRRGSVLRR